MNSIHYFQMIDKSELYQKDYLDLEEEYEEKIEDIKTYIPFQKEEIVVPYIEKKEIKTIVVFNLIKHGFLIICKELN